MQKEDEMVKNRAEKQRENDTLPTWKRVIFNLLFQSLDAMAWIFFLPFWLIYAGKHTSNFNFELFVFLWFIAFSLSFTSISKQIMGWRKAFLAFFVRIICIFCFAIIVIDNFDPGPMTLYFIIPLGMVIIMIGTECLFAKIQNKTVLNILKNKKIIFSFLILFFVILLGSLTHKEVCRPNSPCGFNECNIYIFGIKFFHEKRLIGLQRPGVICGGEYALEKKEMK